MSAAHVRIGIAGLGDWGRNHVRAFAALDGCAVTRLCDPSEKARRFAASLVPSARTAEDARSVTGDPELDAVVVATPAETHYDISLEALRAGKHLLVEKPFVLRREQAEELVELAASRKRVLMVGHLLLYHPVVREMKKRIDAGEIGDLLYMYAVRTNLGKVRATENAFWSFAPHDISTMNHLAGAAPVRARAAGQCYVNPGIEDVVFFSLNYPGKLFGHGQVSWLDPHKQRSLTVVGSKKMLVFDDTAAGDKLKIHDKGVGADLSYRTYGEYMTLRQGDTHLPYIRMEEPLALQAREFLSCIAGNRTPLNDGREALRVLDALLACQQSLERGGAPVDIH